MARRSAWCCSLLLLLAVAGCGTAHYRKSADKEAARIIAEKTPAVPNMDPRFSIDQTNVISLDGLPVNTKIEEFLGTEKESEAHAVVVPLEKALDLGVRFSREYQNQKEMLYLEALNLAMDRHRFTPIFRAGGDVTAQNQQKDVVKAIDELAGTTSSLVQQDTEVVQQYNVSGRGTAGASVLLRSGATLANSLSIDFLRFINGDPRFFVRSTFGATLTQPLMRGFGYKVTMETLTQSERNLLYALRDFTLYRKDFTVRLAQAYYGVLQARDSTRNRYRGYQTFLQNARRGRAFAEEGRMTQSDYGQLEQAALSAETDWISSIRSYKQNLDQFKVLLGLPTDSRLMLDDGDLDGLKVVHPNLSAEEALKVALATRLELQTSRERVEDAERRIVVAADGLKPRVDLVVGGTIESRSGSNNPLDVDTDRARGNAGLNLDLALDRKQQRNSYRAALIARERAAREAQSREDQIKLQIFDDWRNLDQARRSFEIGELGVKLAERRVEEQELRAELGRVTARDLVDAQTSLINSRNARTSALVNHTIARLQFWRDMGILFVKEDGRWEEMSDGNLKVSAQ